MNQTLVEHCSFTVPLLSCLTSKTPGALTPNPTVFHCLFEGWILRFKEVIMALLGMPAWLPYPGHPLHIYLKLSCIMVLISLVQVHVFVPIGYLVRS
jgi:hypothetical protein